jgi:hypothetical protein
MGKRHENVVVRCDAMTLRLLVIVIPLMAFPNRSAPPRTGNVSSQQSQQDSQVTVPAKPGSPLYKGEQGRQRSEVSFIPSNRAVTIKLRVEDPNGYFLPSIRPENFAVYEDGVRQKNVSVEIGHSPVYAALLLEFGGRYQEWNKELGVEIPDIGRQFLDVLGKDDKAAVITYDDKIHVLAGFDRPGERLAGLFDRLPMPGFSEATLYDAVLATLQSLQGEKTGNARPSIILVSSGVDTFSKADYSQVIQAVQNSAIPIYAISLVHVMQREALLYGPGAPLSHLDWNGAEDRLETLARASGGRAYMLDSSTEIAAFYDDIMENLRIRYVVSYISSNPAISGPPRKIRVDLIDPATGDTLKIRDSNGRPVAAAVYVQDAYNPAPASGN